MSVPLKPKNDHERKDKIDWVFLFSKVRDITINKPFLLPNYLMVNKTLHIG